MMKTRHGRSIGTMRLTYLLGLAKQQPQKEIVEQPNSIGKMQWILLDWLDSVRRGLMPDKAHLDILQHLVSPLALSLLRKDNGSSHQPEATLFMRYRIDFCLLCEEQQQQLNKNPIDLEKCACFSHNNPVTKEASMGAYGSGRQRIHPCTYECVRVDLRHFKQHLRTPGKVHGQI